MTKPKDYPKNKFELLKSYIKNNVKEAFGYCVVSGEEQITKELCSDKRPLFCFVAATTASNLKLTTYKCEGFTVEEGEPSIIVREVIVDNTGHNETKPHWNNKYYVLIPSAKGIILNVPLEENKFDKHFVDLVDNDQINETIKSLPPNKSGSIGEYYSNPKSPYVNIEPIENSNGQDDRAT